MFILELLVMLTIIFCASCRPTHKNAQSNIKFSFSNVNGPSNNNLEGYSDKLELLATPCKPPDLHEFYHFNVNPRYLNKPHKIPVHYGQTISKGKKIDTFLPIGESDDISYEKINRPDFRMLPYFIKGFPREETQLKELEPINENSLNEAIRSYWFGSKYHPKLTQKMFQHYGGESLDDNHDNLHGVYFLRPGSSKSNENYLENELISHSKMESEKNWRNQHNCGEENRNLFGDHKIGDRNTGNFFFI